MIFETRGLTPEDRHLVAHQLRNMSQQMEYLRELISKPMRTAPLEAVDKELRSYEFKQRMKASRCRVMLFNPIDRATALNDKMLEDDDKVGKYVGCATAPKENYCGEDRTGFGDLKAESDQRRTYADEQDVLVHEREREDGGDGPDGAAPPAGTGKDP